MAERVVLHVYDLSQGLARQLSLSLLGKVIDAIYHTGIVVYGREYSFGAGIEIEPVGHTRYGRPIQVLEFGHTEVPHELFEEYLEDIRPRYSVETYSLLRHNCNNFSDEVLQFLVGARVPEHILNLPLEVINTPFGASLVPMLEQMETSRRVGQMGGYGNLGFPQTQGANSINFSSIPVPNTVSPSPVISSRSAAPNSTRFSQIPAPSSHSTSTSTQKNFSSGPPEPESATTESGPISTPPKAASAPTKEASGAPKETSKKDPSGEAKAKVHAEISKEFSVLMAAGGMKANEAAALACKIVMERYGALRGGTAQTKS